MSLDLPDFPLFSCLAHPSCIIELFSRSPAISSHSTSTRQLKPVQIKYSTDRGTHMALVQTDHNSGAFLGHLDGWTGLATWLVRVSKSMGVSVRIEARWTLHGFGWLRRQCVASVRALLRACSRSGLASSFAWLHERVLMPEVFITIP